MFFLLPITNNSIRIVYELSTMKLSNGAVAVATGKAKPLISNKSVISLVPGASDEDIPSGLSMTFTLQTTPGQDDLPTYKTSICILTGREDVQTLIKWYRNVPKILHGLGATTYQQKIPIVETLMQSLPLGVFREKLASQKRERFEARIMEAPDDPAAEVIHNAGVDHVDNCELVHIDRALQHTITQHMPSRVLARVKRFMRRECRKPVEMLVREYYSHLVRLNMEILPNLPPFQQNQSLREDEMVDILLFATPKSWQ